MSSVNCFYVKYFAMKKAYQRRPKKAVSTQPRCASDVMRIEEQLGVKLFKRTNGGLLLT